MGRKRAFDELFLEATIQTVAEYGIEYARTRYIAEYAGFSEAAMFRKFPTKEIILRDTFLYEDMRISDILAHGLLAQIADGAPLGRAAYSVWRKVYLHLISHKEETLFLIRYRYSSLYTEEVRGMQRVFSGGLNEVFASMERRYGFSLREEGASIVDYIFDMTLCLAEKVITGKIKDNPDAERGVWTAVESVFWAVSRKPTEKEKGNERVLCCR